MLNPAMSETKVSRRGHGEDAIYFTAAKNRYVGSVSLGYGPDGKRIRREVFGKTKQEVRPRLKGTAPGAERGRQVIAHYSVREAVEDWLHEGLDDPRARRPGWLSCPPHVPVWAQVALPSNT